MIRHPGSSPRGRGKLGACKPRPRSIRLIPARAGKTALSVQSSKFNSAHPRAGGENRYSPGPSLVGPGSSPRGRGKHGPGEYLSVNDRLIPARAGKTALSPGSPQRPAAHPRAGGENFTFGIGSQVIAGSSPRGRGKPWAACTVSADGRLIPARAGKTILLTERKVSAWAHPRAGGENHLT